MSALVRQRSVANATQVSAERRLALLIDAVTDYSLYMLDPDGVILTWNKGATRNKGYSVQGIIGKNYRIFFTVEDIIARKPEALLERARQKGRVEDEGWRVRKDGSRFRAKVTITSIYNTEGEFRGFAKITQDITLQTQQVVLKRAADKVAAESQAKSQFLAHMSHELRTPLNAIIGFTDFLRLEGSHFEASKTKEYLDIIHDSAYSLMYLIDDLLDLSQIESGALSLRFEAFAAHDVLSNIAMKFNQNPTMQNILVVPRTKHPIVVHADIERVTQIVQNFVSNAVKYGRCTGRIVLSARRTANGRVEFGVADDGPGIPKQSRERIFESFVRLDVNAATQGFGIGLSVCRKLAVLMNGQVGVRRSRIGGAHFWCRLP